MQERHLFEDWKYCFIQCVGVRTAKNGLRVAPIDGNVILDIFAGAGVGEQLPNPRDSSRVRYDVSNIVFEVEDNVLQAKISTHIE